MRNLKRVIAICLIMLTTQLAFGEGDTKIIGIRAGYQMSETYYPSYGAVGSLDGFYLGAFKNNKIMPMLHWTFGLEYFQNGYQDKNFDIKRTVHTLSIPVNIKVKLGPLFALVGSGLNMNLSDKTEFMGEDVDDDVNFLDIPLTVGFGFNILILSIEGRYSWGMLNVDSGDGKNQYLQIGAGVSF